MVIKLIQFSSSIPNLPCQAFPHLQFIPYILTKEKITNMLISEIHVSLKTELFF